MPREPSLARPCNAAPAALAPAFDLGKSAQKIPCHFPPARPPAVCLSDVRPRLPSCRPTSTSGSLNLSLSTAEASPLLSFASAALEGEERERGGGPDEKAAMKKWSIHPLQKLGEEDERRRIWFSSFKNGTRYSPVRRHSLHSLLSGSGDRRS